MTLLRISRAVAVAAALGCIALWSTFVWFNPYAPSYHPASRLIAFFMILLWAVAILLLSRDLFRWAYVAFVVAFVPIGLYLLATPGVFLWIGVLTLVFLFATATLHRLSVQRQGPSVP